MEEFSEMKGYEPMVDAAGEVIGHAVRYNGNLYTIYFDNFVDRMDKFKMEFKPRESDIVLLTYVKSGTHWLWEILMMLTRSDSTTRTEHKEIGMVEMTTQDDLDSLPEPRIINTHLAVSDVPQTILKPGGHKIIQIHRNPKDVAVSFYNHMRAEKRGTNLTCDWDYYITKLYLDQTNMPQLRWFEYTKDWWNQSKGMDNFFTVFYEDLHKDPASEIKKIADFLQLEISDTLLQQIVENTSFAAMKQNKQEESETAIEKYFTPEFTMYRKGKVGDWRNHFTKDQDQLFMKTYEEEMKDHAELREKFSDALTFKTD